MKGLELLGRLIEFAILVDSDPLLAERTVAEVEENTWSQPLNVIAFLQTLHVEDVTATAPHARCC